MVVQVKSEDNDTIRELVKRQNLLLKLLYELKLI